MATKKRDGQKCKTRIKHAFTVEEFKERTLQKNKLERDAELKEEQRASDSATAKADIKRMHSEAADLRNQLDDGGEQREVDAVVVIDRKKGNKTFYRFCPGQEGHDEKLKVENMTEADYQSLPLDDSEAKQKEQKEQPAEVTTTGGDPGF